MADRHCGCSDDVLCLLLLAGPYFQRHRRGPAHPPASPRAIPAKTYWLPGPVQHHRCTSYSRRHGFLPTLRPGSPYTAQPGGMDRRDFDATDEIRSSRTDASVLRASKRFRGYAGVALHGARADAERCGARRTPLAALATRQIRLHLALAVAGLCISLDNAQPGPTRAKDFDLRSLHAARDQHVFRAGLAGRGNSAIPTYDAFADRLGRVGNATLDGAIFAPAPAGRIASRQPHLHGRSEHFRVGIALQAL